MDIRNHFRRAAIATILLTAAVVALRSGELRQATADGLLRVQAWGPWGLVAVAVAYVPASLLFLPGSLLTLGSGFVFGVLPTVIAVSLGSTTGATAAMLAGRTLLRPWLQGKLADNPRLAALDRAVERDGAKLVLLVRLSPVIPYNALNYMLGLTRVRVRDYIWASWLGMLPGTVMYAYLGSAAHSLADLASGNVPTNRAAQGLFVFGLAATVALTALVGRQAKRALAEAAIAGDADAQATA